jgi:hypothetical protein
VGRRLRQGSRLHLPGSGRALPHTSEYWGSPHPCFVDYLRAVRIALRSALACLRSFFAVFTEARADVTTVLFEL